MPTAISLYTGVGGLDLGFEAAGYATRVALEVDSICCRMIRMNRGWPLIEADIHAVTSDQILHVAGLGKREADILIGGPPCQPFSKSGYWHRGDALRLDDPRADTLTAYLRVLRDTLPRTFLLENVNGLAFKRKSEGLAKILDGIDQINRETGVSYQPYWARLNAASFGVPQMRERVFIVASRDGRPFAFPSPTHGPVGQGSCLQPYRNSWDALGDLPAGPNDPALRMTGKWAHLLPSIPEGENYLWHTKRGGGKPLFGWRTRYWSFLLKLAKNRPAWTIQAQPGSATGPFHWRSRKLSAQELCRLQTFPDGLVLDSKRGDVQRMLGNAVPSLMAEVLGREIRAQLLDLPLSGSGLSLLPPKRDDLPDPEPIAPVDRRYLRLLGDHDDHPGEGLGNGARARRSRAAA